MITDKSKAIHANKDQTVHSFFELIKCLIDPCLESECLRHVQQMLISNPYLARQKDSNGFTAAVYLIGLYQMAKDKRAFVETMKMLFDYGGSIEEKDIANSKVAVQEPLLLFLQRSKSRGSVRQYG